MNSERVLEKVRQWLESVSENEIQDQVVILMVESMRDSLAQIVPDFPPLDMFPQDQIESFMEMVKDQVIVSLNGQVRDNANNPAVHAAVARKVLREDDPELEQKRQAIEEYQKAYSEEVENFLVAIKGSRVPTFN